MQPKEPLPETALALWGRLSTLDVTRPPTPPDWLIDGLIDVVDLTVFFGPYGSGKSFVALDIALSLATGEPALTTYPTGEPRRVLYVASEGLRNFENRARAWAYHRGKGDPARIADLQDLIAERFRLFVAEDEQGHTRPVIVRLQREDDPGLAALESLTAEGVAEVLVVDVIADIAEGVEENSAAFADGLRKLRGLRVPVIALHHSGKDLAKGMRGSSAAPAAADNVIRITSTVEAWSDNGLNPKRVAVVLQDQPHRTPGTKRREGQHFGEVAVTLGTPEGLPDVDSGNPPATILGPSIAQSFRDQGLRLKPLELATLSAVADLEAEGPAAKVTRANLADRLEVDASVISRRLAKPMTLDLVECQEGAGRSPNLYRMTPKGRAILRGESLVEEPDLGGILTEQEADIIRDLLADLAAGRR